MKGPLGFPRDARLRRKAEFNLTFRQGRRVPGRHFIFYWVERDTPGAKLGLAVSRKVGNAVVRNRVKRYLREFYRTHRPALLKDVYLVVVARPSAAHLDYAGCAGEFGKVLQRGGLL